ncbi:MAG: FAD-dependent oxidoreductase [Balneolaceae bacterium]|nr:FAD-dependent oxidoreductase [Balneolaceae bacterium]MDR9446225.1 FAD-dependent oxidoreductase [Balneolaceae bacterium]
MKIAIIGAGIAGLSAGQALAKKGHEVHVFEKSRGLGGRMATRYSDESAEHRFDHGIGFFSVKSETFAEQVTRWRAKDLVKPWGDKAFRIGTENKKFPFLESLSSTHHNGKEWFTSTQGMNRLGKELARMVHVHPNAHVSGLTFYGGVANQRTKKPWLINFRDSNMVEADAVIVATPAPQAYGILNTCHDEVDTYKIIREIDVVRYLPTFTVMALVDSRLTTPWSTLFLNSKTLQLISNESSKHDQRRDSTENEPIRYVLHSTHKAAEQAVYTNKRDKIWPQIEADLLNEASLQLGDSIQTPLWSQAHAWRYAECENPLEAPYLTNGRVEAPLAVVGDYFQGNSVEDAYLSGIACAENKLFNS